MAETRLQQLRETLQHRKTDLQRLYNFKFESVKLKLFNIQVYIVAVNHPQFQYTNSGIYRGLINEVVKPNEISISFLDDERQTVNGILNLWDGLKYNIATGIHYPKACYEDIGWLIYTGGHQHGQGAPETRRYVLTGLYPIQRDSVSLSFDNNSVEVLSVNFNVDGVYPLFASVVESGTVGI